MLITTSGTCSVENESAANASPPITSQMQAPSYFLTVCRKRRQQVLPPTAASPANQLANAKSRDATANEDLFKKAEKAHPKATLRNRLYEDFGKKREDALGREVAARDTGNAPDLATSTSAPSQPTDLAQAAAAVGVERQLDTMFLDALLPSVRQNPELSLPLVDPLTGETSCNMAAVAVRS